MIKDLISIVVPVYNTGRYLAESLESILAQTYEDWEAVLVNDGSTDDSAEIIQAYCAADDRFRAVSQENQGVSAARNTGIGKTHGEYIVFWDSDDIFPPNALEVLHSTITEKGADLVSGAVTEESFFRTVTPKGARFLAEKDDIDKYDRNLMYTLSVCNKMFRAEIIKDNGLYFNRIRFLEDGDFLMRYIECTGSICGCDEVTYNIRIRPYWEPPSATQQGTAEMFEECREAVARIGGTIRRMYSAERRRLVNEGSDEAVIEELEQKEDALLDTLYYRLASVNIINTFYRLAWRNGSDYTEHLNRALTDISGTISDEKRKFLRDNNPDIDFDRPLLSLQELDSNPVLTIVLREQIGRNDINDVLAGLYAQRMPAFNVYVSRKLRPHIDRGYHSMLNLHFFSGFESLGIAGVLRNTPAEYILVMDKPSLWEPDAFRTMFAEMKKHSKVRVYKADFRGEKGSIAPVGDLNHLIFRTRSVRRKMRLNVLGPVDILRSLADETREAKTQFTGKARVYVGNLEILK